MGVAYTFYKEYMKGVEDFKKSSEWSFAMVSIVIGNLLIPWVASNELTVSRQLIDEMAVLPWPVFACLWLSLGLALFFMAFISIFYVRWTKDHLPAVSEELFRQLNDYGSVSEKDAATSGTGGSGSTQEDKTPNTALQADALGIPPVYRESRAATKEVQ